MFMQKKSVTFITQTKRKRSRGCPRLLLLKSCMVEEKKWQVP